VLPATAQEVENEKRAREAEEAEQREADAQWASTNLSRQERGRAIQDERDTFNPGARNFDNYDPESIEEQESVGR
jgi:hypothetical protein